MPNETSNLIQSVSSASKRDQVQLSFGRAIDWETIDPILLAGECACIFDSDTLAPSDFKFGNGVLTFTQLPSIFKNSEIFKSVYTKTQIDALFSAANTLISTHTQQLQDASKSILSLSSDVLTAQGNTAEALRLATAADTAIKGLSTSVTNSLAGITDKLDPLSTVQNYVTSLSTVKKLISDAQGLALTPEHLSALNSGITADKLLTLTTNSTTSTANIATLTTTSSNNSTNIQKLEASKANKDNDVYYQSTTRVSGGSGYTLYAPCTVNGINGFVTKIENEFGAIALDGLILLQTRTDCSTAPDLSSPVISEMGGSGAEFKVSSVRTSNDLQDTHKYFEKVLSLTAASHLDRGKIDNLLRLVQNGKLVAINIPLTTKYVDASYTGIEQGLEFCPFITGQKALTALGAGSPGTPHVTPGSIYYAAGTYLEDLRLQYTSNKNIVGLAVARQCRTKVNSITIGIGAGSIGLRDLSLSTLTFIEGTGNNFLDNVSVGGITTIGTANYNYAVHCNFNDSVTVTSGTVEFDSCNFQGTTLTVQSGAAVLLKDCTNVSVQVNDGASYTHLSGTVILNKGGVYAISASASAKFVGLYEGVALDSKGAYAPISIPPTVPCALGLFLFKAEGSVLPTSTRISSDGLSSLQVFAGKREGAQEGYKTSSPYLSDHLNKISEAIASIALKQSTPSVTDVQLSQGSVNGQVSLTVTNSNSASPVITQVPVFGLKSAAYTPADNYATASQGTLADTAYQKPTNGIPILHLEQATRNAISGAEQAINKVATTTSTSTDIQYPTAKSLYTQAIEPIKIIQSHVPLSIKDTDIFATEKLVETQIASLTSRVITPKAITQGNESDFWNSMSVLRDPTSVGLNYFHKGGVVVLQLNDEATYLVGTEQWRAQYDGAQWQAKYKLGQQFSSAQQNAVDSGITSLKVAQIAANTASIDTKQEKILSATTANNIQILTDTTTVGAVGKLPIDTELTSAATGVPKTASVTAGIAKKQDTLTKPLSGEAFVKINASGFTTADSTSYLSTSDATRDFLTKTDAATTYYPRSTATTALAKKQDNIPAGISGNLVQYSGTEGVFKGETLPTALSVTTNIDLQLASDSKIPTEKSLLKVLQFKQNAVSASATPQLLGNTSNEGVISTYNLEKSLTDDNIILTKAATISLIDGHPSKVEGVGVEGKLASVGANNTLVASTKSASDFMLVTQGHSTRVVTDVERTSDTPISLRSNTSYLFDAPRENGLDSASAPIQPRLFNVRLPDNVKMFSNITMASGIQSNSSTLPTFSGLWYDRVFLNFMSSMTDFIFNNSTLNISLNNAISIQNTLFNNSKVHFFSKSVSSLSSTLAFTTKSSDIMIDLRGATAPQVSITPMDSVIHVYGNPLIKLSPSESIDIYNRSATIYLHDESVLDASTIAPLDSITVYICKDSTATLPYEQRNCIVTDLRNNMAYCNITGEARLTQRAVDVLNGKVNELRELLTPYSMTISSGSVSSQTFGRWQSSNDGTYTSFIHPTYHGKGSSPIVCTYTRTIEGRKEQVDASTVIHTDGGVELHSNSPVQLLVDIRK